MKQNPFIGGRKTNGIVHAKKEIYYSANRMDSITRRTAGIRIVPAAPLSEVCMVICTCG
ncbi:MAG: hypothetical protein ACU841_01415 [Gammaproteobacteria bacterium]